MFDLDTLHVMNDRAYEDYQSRKKPTTPLGVLRERLRNARPPLYIHTPERLPEC